MITINNLSKSFGKLKVIDNLNLDINDGDFIAIYGPNGCGKTTLLNCLADLINYNGKILINKKSPPNSEVSMVFQSYSDSLFPWRTVLQNVAFALENKIPSKSQSLAINSLKNTMLKEYLHYYPYQISGGMQQLVSIVRAFVYNPDLILLDEPFSSLDTLVKEKVRNELLKLWEKSKLTTIFITHDLDEAILLANKIIILSDKPSKVVDVIDITQHKNNKKIFQSTKFLELKNDIQKKLK